MKPKAIGAVIGLLILLGAIFYFYSKPTGGGDAAIRDRLRADISSLDPNRAVAKLKPSTGPAREVISPAAPKGIAPGAPGASVAPPRLAAAGTPMPFENDVQTSITVITIWADSKAPASGTSITLRGCIGSKAVDGYIKSAYTDAEGKVTMSYPEAFDWLVVTALKSMSPRINPAYERRTGDRASQTTHLLPLTNPLVLELHRGGRIFGTVRRADNGKPVAGATVIGTPRGGGTAVLATSAQDGEYIVDYLAAGQVGLAARGDGLYYDGSDQPLITVAVGEESGPHDILMVPGAIISGKVTSRKDGSPVSGVRVTTAGGVRDIRQHPVATTGGDGRYVLNGLPLGVNPVLTANKTGYAIETATAEIAPNGTATVDFQLGSGGQIEATVYDQKKNPVPGAQIQIGGLLGGGGMDSTAMTDAQGHATITNVSLAASGQIIYITKPGYQSLTTQDKPAFDAQGIGKAEYTITKDETNQLTLIGTVSDASSKPIAGIQIAPLANLPSGDAPPKATTGPDGTYKLGPIDIPARQPVLGVQASGKGWASAVKQAPPSDDPATPVKVDFTLEPGHWIAGTVVDEQKSPLAGIRVSVQQNFGDDQVILGGLGMVRLGALANRNEITTQADGKFRFEDLPNQPATLNAAMPGAGVPVSAQANVDQETEIVVKVAGVIRGRVTDANTKQPIQQFTVSVRGMRGYSSSDAIPKPFSDPDGRFVLQNVDRNQANRLLVQSTGYSQTTKDNVEAASAQSADAAPEVAIELTPAQPLTITLVDKASGAPIAGASLIAGVFQGNMSMPWDSLVRISDGGPITSKQMLTTDASGSAVAFEGGVPLTIVIHAAGYPDLTVPPANRAQYSAGGNQLKIPLSRGGSISGVAFLDGQPAANQSILINLERAQAGSASFNKSMQTDGAGRFKFAELPAGSFILNLMKRFGNQGVGAIAKRVALAEGQDLVVNIGDDPGPTALFGVVRQGGAPAAGAAVSLNPAFNWDYTNFGTMTDSNGEYHILGLQPGSYRVLVRPTSIAAGGQTLGANSSISDTVVVADTPTQRDFNFEPAHKLSLHLVYPPGFPADVRSSIRYAILMNLPSPNAGLPNQPISGQIDRQAQTSISAGDRLVFSGRFQGSYTLMLQYTVPPPSGQTRSTSGSINVFQGQAIDNTQGDIDMGDVPVPMPPAAQ